MVYVWIKRYLVIVCELPHWCVMMPFAMLLVVVDNVSAKSCIYISDPPWESWCFCSIVVLVFLSVWFQNEYSSCRTTYRTCKCVCSQRWMQVAAKMAGWFCLFCFCFCYWDSMTAWCMVSSSAIIFGCFISLKGLHQSQIRMAIIYWIYMYI